MADDLSPCPFCGGEALIFRAHQNKMLAMREKATDDHYLFTLSHHDCVEGQSIVWAFKPKASLVAAWNTRAGFAGIPDPAAFVEAARGMREALEFYADLEGDGYDVRVTDYGLSTEEGGIIRDRGKKACTALTAFRAAMREGQSDD